MPVSTILILVCFLFEQVSRNYCSYAGTQAGHECFCSNNLTQSTKYGQSTDCWGPGMGGSWALDIYEIHKTPRDVAWIQILECDETTNDFTYYHRSQWLDLQKQAISIKIVPVGSKSNPQYDDFAVVAVPCSNPVIATQNNFAASYVIDENTLSLTGYANINNWIGTATAKARLWNNNGMALDSFDDVIYRAGGNQGGIHLSPLNASCYWDWSDSLGQDIAVYLGFDVDGNDFCEPTQSPTSSPTSPSQNYFPNSLCVNGEVSNPFDLNGKYEYHSFDSNLNAPNYYKPDNNLYIYPYIASSGVYRWCIGTNLDSRTVRAKAPATNHDSIFDSNGQWKVASFDYGGYNAGWIDEPTMNITECSLVFHIYPFIASYKFMQWNIRSFVTNNRINAKTDSITDSY